MLSFFHLISKLKFNFCQNIHGFICDRVRVVASKKVIRMIGTRENLYDWYNCIVSYFLCISFVSGLESRGSSKLFIVSPKGLLKLILHFFNVLIISTNFWVLYRTINIRHICSLYHSLVHSSTPQQPMTPSLCGSSTHHPRILISHSFVFVQLPVHLFNHIETWVVLSAWLVTKKEK